MLTPGQADDLTGAQLLLDDVDPHALIGDKAYDADPLLNPRSTQHCRGISSEGKPQDATDLRLRALLRAQLVERFFNKLKNFRAIATRYDKLARNFLAGVQLACAIILLN